MIIKPVLESIDDKEEDQLTPNTFCGTMMTKSKMISIHYPLPHSEFPQCMEENIWKINMFHYERKMNF